MKLNLGCICVQNQTKSEILLSAESQAMDYKDVSPYYTSWILHDVASDTQLEV